MAINVRGEYRKQTTHVLTVTVNPYDFQLDNMDSEDEVILIFNGKPIKRMTSWQARRLFGMD